MKFRSIAAACFLLVTLVTSASAQGTRPPPNKLSQLTGDTNISSPASNNILEFNGTKWANASLGTGIAPWLGTPTETNFKSAQSGLAWLDTAQSFTASQTISGASLILSGNQSAAAWTTNGLRLKGIAGTITDTSSSGTVAAAYTDKLGGNTIAASSATTFTEYASLKLSAPLAGTNVTFTNPYALDADSATFGTSNPVTITTAGLLNVTNASSAFNGTVGASTPAAGTFTKATIGSTNGIVFDPTKALANFGLTLYTEAAVNTPSTPGGLFTVGTDDDTKCIGFEADIKTQKTGAVSGAGVMTYGTNSLFPNYGEVFAFGGNLAIQTDANKKIEFYLNTGFNPPTGLVETIDSSGFLNLTAHGITSISGDNSTGGPANDTLHIKAGTGRYATLDFYGPSSTREGAFGWDGGSPLGTGAQMFLYVNSSKFSFVGSANSFTTSLSFDGSTGNLTAHASSVLGWGSSGVSSPDTGIARNAVGVAEVNSGTAGTFRDLKLRKLTGVQTVAGTVGSTYSLNVTLGRSWTMTTTASTALAITPTAAGTADQIVTLIITSDATGGDVVTFASPFKPSGTMTLTASKVHTIQFISDGTNLYELSRTTGL